VAIRDAGAAHRQCTPLELLFDLCFVVSVAALVVELHHAVAEGRAGQGVWTYGVLFLPVCWAWMLFSWFATAYDNDDVVYRLLTFAQMAGVLALTVTVPAAFHGELFPFAACYFLMRIPLVLKWVRAARADSGEPGYAVRYVLGLSACQLVWLTLLVLPALQRPLAVLAIMVLELAVPSFALGATTGPVFHVRHISERFGLFTLIVLGESIFAATTALKESLKLEATAPMVVIGVSTLLSAFCLWWLYFDLVDGRAVALLRSRAVWWGHGHLLTFSAIGAVGAGAQVAVQAQVESLAFDSWMRIAVVAPAALSILSLALIHSVTDRSARFDTVSRVLAALIIVVGGVRAGAHGPMGATLVVGAVLLGLASIETWAKGMRARGPWTAPE
jgi:low temperature requirement protein LtrA